MGWKNSPPLVEGDRPCPGPDTGGGGGLLRPGSNFVGLFMFAFGASMFIFGWRNNYTFFKTLSLLPVIYGITMCLYGLKIANVLSFPILYLLFLVPVPLGIIDNITLPMRYGVSIVTEEILKLLHYPITREGLLLSIGGSELFVGQPCSGFRSMITMLSAGLIFVYISKGNMFKKSVIASSIIPFALLGNLIRIIMLCLITYHFGEAAGQGFFHNFSGIVVVVLITLGLIGLEYAFGKYLPNTSTIPHSPAHGGALGKEMSPAGGGRIPRLWWKGNKQIRDNGSINTNAYITNAVLLFTIVFCFGFFPAKRYESHDIFSQLQIPHKIGSWQGSDTELDWNLKDKEYKFISQILAREYQKDDKELYLLVLNARDFHNPKTCSSGAGFKVRELDDFEFYRGNSVFKAHTLYVQKKSEGFLLIYWVCIDRKIADWTEQKIKEFWFSLMDKQTPGLMVRLDIPCKEDNIENAMQIAQSFVTDLGMAIPSEEADYIFGMINL